jgi:hypothetical protein
VRLGATQARRHGFTSITEFGSAYGAVAAGVAAG